MANESDYVELGLACANVCKALDRGMNGRKLDDLNQSVREAIALLTTWVKPVMHASDNSLTTLSSKDCGRDSKEGHQTRQAECSLSTCLCEK